jgi:hypothetical protein
VKGRAEAGVERRLTGFVGLGNQNKQTFQCEGKADKFLHTNGLGILLFCVYMSVYLRCVKQNTAVFSPLVICFQTNLKRKMKQKFCCL